MLRGASKDVLNEVERNLQDAMCVTRNVMLDPRLVPGGGACEMALANALDKEAMTFSDRVTQQVFLNMAKSLEVIPSTLIKNAGANVLLRTTELRQAHYSNPEKNWTLGVDGKTGKLVDMKDFGVWDPLAVKVQTLKTSIEVCISLVYYMFRLLRCSFALKTSFLV